jgi:anti-sigma regulatory factor (Ser/Thr protein kinase)
MQDAFVARQVFPRKPEAVSPARNWAEMVYRLAGGTQAEVCALLVSELATNAVEYADGERFEVTVWASPLRVDVRDGSLKEPERQKPGDEDEHGRGLILISELSERFAVTRVDDGKICTFWLKEEDRHETCATGVRCLTPE